MTSFFCGGSLKSHVSFFSIIFISSSIVFLRTSCFEAASKFFDSTIVKLHVWYIFDSDMVHLGVDSRDESSPLDVVCSMAFS